MDETIYEGRQGLFNGAFRFYTSEFKDPKQLNYENLDLIISPFSNSQLFKPDHEPDW